MKRLDEVLSYNKDTGELTRLLSAGGVYVGDIVGCKRPNGYLMVSVNGKQRRSHRVAWELFYGEEPKGPIDHINGIRDDNRIENLRVVTVQDNNKNLKIGRRNKSGILGVSWEAERCGWVSYIGIGRKGHFKLGRFDNLLDAASARKSAEINHGYHANHGKR